MKLHQYYEKQKEEEAKFEEQNKDSEGEYWVYVVQGKNLGDY